MDASPPDHDASSDALDTMRRFRSIMAWAVALAALGFLGYAVWTGLAETANELRGFNWPLYVPILLLTLVNYGLRYVKWAYLLGELDVKISHRLNLPIFVTGLAMVITPGKAGELIKPYLVRTATGAPMMRTVPALVTERLTDGIAVVILAALGVSTFLAESAPLILGTLALTVAGLVVLSIEPLAHQVLRLTTYVPLLNRVTPRLEEAYTAMRTCVAPWPLAFTIGLSLVAWWAECVGYWLVFEGLGVTASLDASTFVYAFATVFGAPSPGGMGMADAALVETARSIIPGLTQAQSLAAALLVRIATLWFGVILGALTLLRIESLLRDDGKEIPPSPAPPAP